MIVGAKTDSEVGLAQNEVGVGFRCGTCRHYERGICHNPNPKLDGRPVWVAWCCNLYDHNEMKVIV